MTPYPPTRESPDLSVIGVSVGLQAALWGHTPAQYAYFVRLEDEESLVEAVPIRSNFAWDGYVFLFNAQPGRYAVVAAGYDTQASSGSGPIGVGGGVSVGMSMTVQSTVRVYLPEDLIEKTTVSVGRGEWVFMGETVLGPRGKDDDWEAADDVQRHYLGALGPAGYEEMNILEKAFGGGTHYPGTEVNLDRGAESLERFLATSREVADEGWASALRSSVAAGPPDP